MKTIDVSHDVWVQISQGGGMWWPNSVSDVSEGEIVEVRYKQPSSGIIQTMTCIVTQRVPDANNGTFYRLVKQK